VRFWGLNWEGAKEEGHSCSLEILKCQSFKAKGPRLGEFPTLILLFGMNCVKILCKSCMICICSVILLNSGNFPETAWRTIHSRQAAHPFLHVFLCSWVQRLAVNPCTARRLKAYNYSGFFCMKRLAGLVVTARRRESETRFWLSYVFWRELFRGKARGGS